MAASSSTPSSPNSATSADFVGTGEEAVAPVGARLRRVLMDMTLPGIDGLEATRPHPRAAGLAAARTPIIGITGRSEAGDETKSRAPPAMDSYLRKPMSPSSLSEAIAAVTS
jgi:CheY-like chemotaxis protein